jgi:hypothetical protein
MVRSRKNIKKTRDFTAKTSKSKNVFDKTRGGCVKIVAGSELSLVSSNSMSRRNQLSWKWRQWRENPPCFCEHFFAEHFLQ